MTLCRQAGRVDSAVNAGYHIGILRDHGARAGAANERGWTIDGEESAMLHPGARGLPGGVGARRPLRLFGEGKQWHGMRRFRLRRLWRVNTEALLMATGQNFKRLLQQRGWGRRPFSGGAAAAANAFSVLSCWLVAVCDGGAAGYFRTPCHI